ncbi:MAG: hypothetical protein ABL918_10015 [Chakrabartia sp.]
MNAAAKIDNGAFIARMLTSGGDKRICVATSANTNMYGASPFPRSILGYAASTANDISLDAFDHLKIVTSAWPVNTTISGEFYANALEKLRVKIKQCYTLPTDTDIVFAPSGTDLEYVALALAKIGSRKAVTNIILGADEVGSGCILSAQGKTFATETALRENIIKGSAITGLEDTHVIEVPVRDAVGEARTSCAVADDIDFYVATIVKQRRHALVHIVHGSKTGLILPRMSEIDRLIARHGAAITFVVDACQARINAATINDYLIRGVIVLLSGSKFMGGPPFSGFALVPPRFPRKKPLPTGLKIVFRRGEWPLNWSGADIFDNSANPGLLLRLEAALFELDRFSRLGQRERTRVITHFRGAVSSFVRHLDADIITGSVEPSCPNDHLIERFTLATINLSRLPHSPDFATAQRWQRVLAARGLRLGQPVKCVKLPSGAWAGTLRVSLSMPLMITFSNLTDDALTKRLDKDMARITNVLGAAASTIAA